MITGWVCSFLCLKKWIKVEYDDDQESMGEKNTNKYKKEREREVKVSCIGMTFNGTNVLSWTVFGRWCKGKSKELM